MSIRKKILFTTLVRIDNINESGIYSDLISKFVSEGYDTTIVCRQIKVDFFRYKLSEC
jgi:hypothetical protein